MPKQAHVPHIMPATPERLRHAIASDVSALAYCESDSDDVNDVAYLCDYVGDNERAAIYQRLRHVD